MVPAGARLYAPGYVSPYPTVDPNSHLPSSSQPSSDTSRASDYFDLSPKGAGTSTVRGDPNAPFSVNGVGGPSEVAPPPAIHVVQRGDTLWDLCAKYFQNPWEWPKIWSYNPELQNPHWIYPGDQLRLQPKEGPPSEGTRAQRPGPSHAIARRTKVPPDTVFLRDQGYLDDKVDDVWGELGGSPEDQLLLSEGDEAYIEVVPGHEVTVGQELTIFRPIQGKLRGDAKGMLVAILGTAKIDKWDPEKRIARATLIESLDVIERGAKVGPVGRRFDVVPPVRNEVELTAQVAASLYPYVLYGQNQVVFIDRGRADGLVPGNRLSAVTQGDEYRKTLFGASDYAAASVRYESEKPAVVEKDGARGHGDDHKYSDENIGEVRVLSVREHTATCLVVSSAREIEPGQRVVAKRGY
jgi:hypothetical protein